MSTKTINIVKLNNNLKKPLTITFDLESHVIEGSLDGKNVEKFSGFHMYDSFRKFNKWLQGEGWLPLCNGARIDAQLSGLLAEASDGLSVYLLDEPKKDGFPVIGHIFDDAPVDKIGTIKQQELYFEKFRQAAKQTLSQVESSLLERFIGCLAGLACGDAVGTAVEFRARGSFLKVTDILGGGPFNLKPGEWTDDTSMALCLASSLIGDDDVKPRGFDPIDQMKRYLMWRNDGYMSATGRCFDIGNTVSRALQAFETTGEPYSGPTDVRSAGNGSIMRLAPVPMFYFSSLEETVKYAELSSKTTHGADEAVDACHIFSLMIHNALKGASKDEIIFNTKPLRSLTEKIIKISNGEYVNKNIDEIVGNGYVVNSLEAALWCFYTTDNYKDAVLKATNLGDDADTTAAICGQISGAYYGIHQIPKNWIYSLAKRDMILSYAKKLHNFGVLNTPEYRTR